MCSSIFQKDNIYKRKIFGSKDQQPRQYSWFMEAIYAPVGNKKPEDANRSHKARYPVAQFTSPHMYH
jgi:hypothetical protein